MGGLTVLSSILVFLVVILSLVGILIFTKSKLAPAGKIKIKINGEKSYQFALGSGVAQGCPLSPHCYSYS